MQDTSVNKTNGEEKVEVETTTSVKNGSAQQSTDADQTSGSGVETQSADYIDLLDASSDGESDGAESEEKVAVTEEQFRELNDRYMRALADAENIRRRAEKDLRDVAKFHSTRLARDLLPVHDNLKRALASVEGDEVTTAESVIEGIQLTLKELLKAFSAHGVEIIAPEHGDPFDSKLHEAMFQVPADDVEVGKILTVMTEGFMIHDRLLRPAQVGVSAGPTQNQESSNTESAES